MENKQQQDAAEMVLDAAFDMAARVEKLEQVNADLCKLIEDAAENCRYHGLPNMSNRLLANVAAAKAVLK